MHLNMDKLRNAELVSDPFSYCVVPGFLGQDSLRRINETYPTIEKGGSFPIDSLDAGMMVKEVIQELDGPEFEAAISEKFGVELNGRPKMYSLRGYTRAKDGRITPTPRTRLLPSCSI